METDYTRIPWATMETLEAWVATARPMGSFCEAVVCNDLAEAFAQADDDNIRAMFDIVAWMYWKAPGICWGSREKMKNWSRLKKAERDARNALPTSMGSAE